MGKNSRQRGGKKTKMKRKETRTKKFGRVQDHEEPAKKKAKQSEEEDVDEKEYELDDSGDEDAQEEDSEELEEEEMWGSSAQERVSFWEKYDAEEQSVEVEAPKSQGNKTGTKRGRQEIDDDELDRTMLAPRSRIVVTDEQDEESDNAQTQEAGEEEEEGAEEDEEEEDGDQQNEDITEGSTGPNDDSSDDDDDDEHLGLVEGKADAEKPPADLINVDFEFHDPQENDFHFIKNLILRYLDDREFDASGFADAICAQTRVGTTVRVADYDETYAFMTVLNVQRHAQQLWMQQIKKTMIAECPDDATRKKMQQLFENGDAGKPVGLIVSGRVINFPPQLLPHLNRALFDEVEWAKTDEPTKELQDSYKFSKYVVLARVYEAPDARVSVGGKKSQKKKNRELSDSELFYTQLDEEISAGHAEFAYNFKSNVQLTESQKVAAYGMTQRRRVIVFNANKGSTIQKRLLELMQE